MKYHLVHHRLGRPQGHRFNEARGFQRELASRAVPLLLYMHESADAHVRDALPDGRAVLRDYVFDKQLNFDQRTDAFVQMLHRHLDGDLARNDRVVVTVATQCEARAFTKWLVSLPMHQTPWVIVFIFADRWNWMGAEESAAQLAEWCVLRGELAALDAAQLSRIIFAAATPSLAEEVMALTGTPAIIAPTPFDVALLEPPGAFPTASAHRALRVGLLGGARLEKGSRLVPSIIPLARARANVEFTVQLSNEGLPAAEFQLLESLAGSPGVLAFSDPREYERVLHEADILLMPYEALPYRRRTSGIFFEGVIGGKPVVVPSGTWMAEQVQTGRAAGVIFNEWTAESVVGALAACVQAFPSLEQRARALAADWRRKEGVGAFVDTMELEISARKAPSSDAAAVD